MSRPIEHIVSRRMRLVDPGTLPKYGAWLRGAGIISFAGGLPDPAFFDDQGLREAYDHVLDIEPDRALQYADGEGEPELRRQAARLVTEKGHPTGPDDLVITTGSQQGINLIGTVLIDPGDVILMEGPTYMSAVRTFRLSGARLVSVDTDMHGIVPEDLEAKIKRHRPKLVYLIPTFQNPTGISMPSTRRSAVAEVLGGSGVLLVEDDPYSELRFRGISQPPLASDPRLEGRAIMLSTLSKVVAPGLRIGWLRVPERLRPVFVAAKRAADMHTSTIDQLAAAYYADRFMRDPHRLDPVRQAYRERCQTMIRAVERLLPEGTRTTHPDGGMFVWVGLPEGYDTDQLLHHAIEAGVSFLPGAGFYADRPVRSNLRMSFCTYGGDTIEQGVERLAAATRTFSSGNGSRRLREGPELTRRTFGTARR